MRGARGRAGRIIRIIVERVVMRLELVRRIVDVRRVVEGILPCAAYQAKLTLCDDSRSPIVVCVWTDSVLAAFGLAKRGSPPLAGPLPLGWYAGWLVLTA